MMMKSVPVAIKMVCIAAAGIFATTSAHAAFPEKPLTFIVPFGAGGGFDGLARGLAKRMEKHLNQPVTITNMPGAGGRRGSIHLFKSKADGYTFGFAHFVPFQTDELLLGKKPAIDTSKLEIIYKISHSRHFVYVNKKSGFKSVEDLKKAGRPIKFATTGIGSITWVEGSALGSTVGFPVQFVSGYKNLPAAALSVAKGSADAGVGSAHHFKGVVDDVNVITYLGAKRDSHFKDAPSIKELGYNKLTVLGSPRIVSAPPGAPKDRLEVIRAAIKKALDEKDFQVWAEKAGYSLDPAGPSAARDAIEQNGSIYKALQPLLKKSK